MVLRRRFVRRSRKGIILAVITGALWLGADAGAYHSACPFFPDLDPTSTSFVGVGTGSTSTSQSVCYSVDPGGTAPCQFNCGRVTLTLGDPDPASAGRTVDVFVGQTQAGGNSTGATGLETGFQEGLGVGDVIVKGTTLWVAGSDQPLTGDDDTGVTRTGPIIPTLKFDDSPLGIAVCGSSFHIWNNGALVETVRLWATVGSGQTCP